MGTITNEQIQKINNQCRNGWRLDVQYYIYHNEKTLVKHININEENYLEFALRYTYENKVSLHISKFYHKVGDSFACSNGLGKSKIINEEQINRKSINKLIEYTNNLTDDELLRINAETPVIQSGIFVESEEF